MVNKFIIGVLVLVLFSALCSCSQKRYYPKKQRPKGKCGCGGFSQIAPHNQLYTYQYESTAIC